MIFKNPRKVLNKLKWHHKYDINEAEIWYVHRGAPDDTKIISGEEVEDIGRSFMKTTSARIPFHRIFKIIYKDEEMFNRKKRKQKK
ncbi:MAG: RNA repair domain-containing protein [Candidatus Thermoplasmatota archaeon]